MSLPNNEETRLALLSDLLLSGDLDERGAEELLEIFQKDGESRTDSADNLLADFLLRQVLGTDSPPPANLRIMERAIPTTRRRGMRRYQLPILGLLVSNVLLLILIFFWSDRFFETRHVVEQRFVHSVSSDSSENVRQDSITTVVDGAMAERSTNAVAVIKTMADVVWQEQTRSSYRAGDLLSPGWIRMHDGHLQIDFFSGASVIIEGECEFQIQSHNLAFCKRGKVVAEVPEQAIGFQINTPQMEVVDLGTSFSVDVSDAGSAVRVLQGMVEIGGLSKGQLNLKQGDSIAVDGAGNMASLGPVDDSGLTFGAIKDMDRTTKRLQYERWKQNGEYLKNDPSLLVHFDFEREKIRDRTVDNVADAGKGGSKNGFLVDGRYSEGRWIEKRAVTFGKIPDRLRFSVDGEFEAVTLVASICVNGLNQSYNTIFSTHGFSQGQAHWHLYHDGKVAVDINSDDNLPPQKIVSNILITPDMIGKWVQLAAVIDLSDCKASIYLNGELKYEERFRMSRKLQFGNCELGNWSTYPLWYEEYPVRSFGGAIDEFLFFSRALSKDEIKCLFFNESDPRDRN